MALCRVNADIEIQMFTKPISCFLEVEVGLEPHPECLGGAKIAGQAKRRVGGNRPFAVNNLIDTARRNADFPGDAVLAQSHGHQELLEKHLAGVNVFQPVHFGHRH